MDPHKKNKNVETRQARHSQLMVKEPSSKLAVMTSEKTDTQHMNIDFVDYAMRKKN